MDYSIVEEASFLAAVQKLGGALRVDTAIEILVEPLSRKPHEFRSIELGGNRFRYAVTRPIKTARLPALVVIFTIDDETRQVKLQHVEEADFPYGDF